MLWQVCLIVTDSFWVSLGLFWVLRQTGPIPGTSDRPGTNWLQSGRLHSKLPFRLSLSGGFVSLGQVSRRERHENTFCVCVLFLPLPTNHNDWVSSSICEEKNGSPPHCAHQLCFAQGPVSEMDRDPQRVVCCCYWCRCWDEISTEEYPKVMELQNPLLEECEAPTQSGREARQTQAPATLLLATLFMVSFTGNINISLMAPFLPQHFRSLGLSQLWCGVMFSGYSLTNMVCSSLAVICIQRWGRVFVLFTGLVLQGMTSLTFGYADELGSLCPGTAVEGALRNSLIIYTASRLIAGMGGAFANTVVYAMAADRFPDALGKVMGANEVVIGMGFTLGPPIGMMLFELGGFPMPFMVSGLALLAFSPWVVPLRLWEKPRSSSSGSSSKSSRLGLFTVLTKNMVLVAGSLLAGSLIFASVEPTLSLYLQQVGMDPAKIAVVFTVLAAAYSLFGPVAGAIADLYGPSRLVLIGAMMSGLIMMLLLGPDVDLILPARSSSTRFVYEVLAMALLGTAQACILIPSLPAMKAAAPQQSQEATELVIAWFNMTLQLGFVTGPILGSALFEAAGFEMQVLNV